MRIIKIIIGLCIGFSLVGCTPNPNNIEAKVEEDKQEVQEDTSLFTKDTIDDLLSLNNTKKLFDIVNVLTFESIEKVEEPYESEYDYVRVKVKNNSAFEITPGYFYYYKTKNTNFAYTQYDITIQANGEKEYVMSSYDSVDIDEIGKLAYYDYKIQLGDVYYGIEVRLVDELAEIQKYDAEDETYFAYETTYLPNNGYTIFVWNDGGEYSFDILRGIEGDGCFTNRWDEAPSVYDKMLNSTSSYYDRYHPFYVLNGYKDEELTDDMKHYVDDVMSNFEIPYAYSDETDKIEEAKQYYGTFVNYYLVSKGNYVTSNKTCDYSYCMVGGEMNTMEFTFSNEELATLEKGKYTVTELNDFIKQHKMYDFYAVGAEHEFSEEEAENLARYFNYQENTELWRILVQNQIIRGADKPAIYLYPEEDSIINVTIESEGNLLTTYPDYGNGWTVLAETDGTLHDLKSNRTYSYLFWEGESYTNYDMSKGFVVAREDTVAFLLDKLAYMGMNDTEINEFIVYWLPRLNKNSYNFICFQEEQYTETWKLHVTPKPDTEIRVFMTWYGLDEPVEVKEQELPHNERNGYTLVEWGGTEINK